MTQRRSGWIIALLLFAVLCAVSFFAWHNFLITPIVTQDEGFKYKLRLGESAHTFARELHEAHVLAHPHLFTFLILVKGDRHHLKAGEYLFPKGTTPASLLEQIVNGTGLVYHKFTIVPGSSFRQVREALNRDDALSHTTKNLSNAEIMKRLGYPSLHPEGQFFPDTYAFVDGVSDLVVLKRAFAEMQEKFNHAWEHRAPDLPFKNPQDALIVASIIEKEADVPTELPIIAGVLVNRLHRDMLLQFDPTVIYGLGSRFNGTIYRRDLLADTPYNTYVHKGLPPTPISMPSMAAIDAALHPDKNNYLYFVARGDGVSHQFSRTLADHNAAVTASKHYRADRPGYFNSALIKQYLLKSFDTKIFNTN